ncbi:MAG: prolyl oligopeptidase family serine peptidase [Gemmatimonadota bacterium]
MHMQRICIAVLGLAVFSTPALSLAQTPPAVRGSLRREITRTVEMEYLIYLPSEYEASAEEWPLMIYLHGGGLAGIELERMESFMNAWVLPSIEDLSLILLAPVLPGDGPWRSDDLATLLDQVSANYQVDQDRVYLVGYSRGGNGAWNLGADYSRRFAAVVPIAGRGVANVCRIKPAAVWIFHGVEDTTVPPETSESMNRSLEGCDANVRLTLYPDVGHDSQTPTFQNPAFWKWLLSQKRN